MDLSEVLNLLTSARSSKVSKANQTIYNDHRMVALGCQCKLKAEVFYVFD